MLRRKNTLFFLIFLTLITASLLFAREVTVLVEDLDIGMPLEGAVIRSWDGNDFSSDTDGIVIITVPDDRQITIQVSYPGYETGRLVIPTRGSSFSIGLRLGSALESRELTIEAPRPGTSETRSGRSVAISGEAMERSSQIGLIEDVMTSIKLLPGVGYSGMFNAMPSIRGGDPGDLMSALDGFYIANPYHWGGGFSIFDPHMVSSAQLSHGIFSTRFGHTISGLLEVSSKRAAPDYAELELGISTSAVNLNAALPLGNRGGFMLMGKATYWDPFIWFLKQLSKVSDNERLQMINAVTTAPYIRSSGASFNYRINQDLEVSANAFIGADGVGADYSGSQSRPWVEYSQRAVFAWDNLQTFFITNLSYNPVPSMLLKVTAGAGYEESNADAKITYDYLRVYNTLDGVRDPPDPPQYELFPDQLDMFILATQVSANIQGRLDFDWSLGNGFLFAAGVQELYTRKISEFGGKGFMEVKSPFEPPPWLKPLIPVDEFYIRKPFHGQLPKSKNEQFNTSAYMLGEYLSPSGRLGTELGLRLDHQLFVGDGFNMQTKPVLNPRLNLDYNVFKNRAFIGSLDLTAGTGLFSSMNNAMINLSPTKDTDDYSLRPNRSWTSVLGLSIDFEGNWSFNIEGYFKYVYDRIYQLIVMEYGKETRPVLRSDGNGIVWGFDFMIQKFESRYWDGWLSYTFTHARYHEPKRSSSDFAYLEDSDDWYYPYFHRFHNANLVLNFKPFKNFSVYLRFGLASGRPKSVVGEITRYYVVLMKEDDTFLEDPKNPGVPMIIQNYKRESSYSDSSRTTWSMPLDLKLSYRIFNPKSKVHTEMYLAAENLASLFYVAQANTRFNSYTGTEDTGSDSANYEMPFPMVSVGIKWSF